MQFTVQRRLAGQLLKCSPKRVHFDNEALTEIKEAITKADIRGLIKRRAIIKIPSQGISKSRTRDTQAQKAKGRRKGQGSRKGRSTARAPTKERWVAKARLQRSLIKTLKQNGLITPEAFRELYFKIKGGFFRNKRHIKLYVEEHGMIKK